MRQRQVYPTDEIAYLPRRILAAKITADALWEKLALEKREQELIRVRTEDLPKWLHHGGCTEQVSEVCPTAYLRICPTDSTTVETSHGATVPLSHIQRVLPAVLRIIADVVASGQEWRSNGQSIKIGYYTLNRIDTEGTVYAGCHRFEYSEVQRFAGMIDSMEVSQ